MTRRKPRPITTGRLQPLRLFSTLLPIAPFQGSLLLGPHRQDFRDKSQKQRGRNPKEDIFTNPVAQGRKVQ